MKTGLDNNRKNIICGAVVCAIAAFFFYWSRTHIKVNALMAGYGTDSRSIPSAIFGFMFVMGALLIVQSLLRMKKGFVNTKEYKPIPKEDIRHMLIIIGAIIVYGVLVRYVGYFVMTAVLLAFLFLYTKVSVKTTVIITVCSIVVLYVLFVIVLKVPITMNVPLI